ncbi:MAG: hypothetical protein A2Z88_02985 [Omnitrophica WOR_2 bacterium GWA2_47_8]|nr:MAG: hypothetical protein A2Z88_02985 [Omnitrophica WOR_2 bacterium GWA2_47_8]
MDNPLTNIDNKIRTQLERAQKELTLLYNISNAMRTTLELDHILYIILTSVTAHTGLGFNRAFLFLVNKSDRTIEAKMAIGPESGEHADKIWNYIRKSEQDLEDLISRDKVHLTFNSSKLYQSIKDYKASLDPTSNNLLTKIYFQGAPMRLTQEDLAQYSHDPLLNILQTPEIIAVPLKAQDMVNGIILADNLYTKKPITDEDLKISEMLANQAGLAIENSRLYEMIVQKSHKDSLTGLWNHGYFQNALAEEIKKAQNNNAHTSLLMIDIDNFKKLNDTLGHQIGDIVLCETAEILKKCARENDHVCRYGGEEFSIVLSQTDKRQAYAIAERIRENFEHYKFKYAATHQDIHMTVSIGLATFPEDTQIQSELIEKADKAMYIAKVSGKNQTIVYEPGS